MTTTQEMTTPETSTSTDFDKLVMTRMLPATPERIFAAWTQPGLAQRWMSPEGMTTPEAEFDLRLGGSYRIVMKSPDDQTHIASGVYREIVQNEKLVYSWKWDHLDLVTQVTVKLRPVGENETELTLTHEGFADQEMRDDHEQGWTGCFDKLSKLQIES